MRPRSSIASSASSDSDGRAPADSRDRRHRESRDTRRPAHSARSSDGCAVVIRQQQHEAEVGIGQLRAAGAVQLVERTVRAQGIAFRLQGQRRQPATARELAAATEEAAQRAVQLGRIDAQPPLHDFVGYGVERGQSRAVPHTSGSEQGGPILARAAPCRRRRLLPREPQPYTGFPRGIDGIHARGGSASARQTPVGSVAMASPRAPGAGRVAVPRRRATRPGRAARVLLREHRQRTGPGAEHRQCADAGSARLHLGRHPGAACTATTATASRCSSTTRNRPDSLPESFVTALAQGEDGRLWVGTNTHYVAEFDPVSSRRVGALHGFRRGERRDMVTALLYQPGRGLWVGTGAGIELYDPVGGARREVLRFTGDPDDDPTVGALHLDQAGRLWAATTTEGLYRIGADLRPERIGRLESTFALWADRDQALWVGASDGVHRLDRDSLSPAPDVAGRWIRPASPAPMACAPSSAMGAVACGWCCGIAVWCVSIPPAARPWRSSTTRKCRPACPNSA
jgi:hypothetical protein